jgi:hypothetical protein
MGCGNGAARSIVAPLRHWPTALMPTPVDFHITAGDPGAGGEQIRADFTVLFHAFYDIYARTPVSSERRPSYEVPCSGSLYRDGAVARHCPRRRGGGPPRGGASRSCVFSRAARVRVPLYTQRQAVLDLCHTVARRLGVHQRAGSSDAPVAVPQLRLRAAAAQRVCGGQSGEHRHGDSRDEKRGPRSPR